MRCSNPQATTAAQAAVRFLYEGVQFPPYLAQYAGFFTCLFAGALGGFALSGYFQRNKCNKAKVKLAVHHIFRIIQESCSFNAMVPGPQTLATCLLAAPSARQSVFVGRADASTPHVDEKDDGYESDLDSNKSFRPADTTAQVAEGLQVADRVRPPRHNPAADNFSWDYEDPDLYSDDKWN